MDAIVREGALLLRRLFFLVIGLGGLAGVSGCAGFATGFVQGLAKGAVQGTATASVSQQHGSPNSSSPNGRLPVATYYGDYDGVKMALDAGADVNERAAGGLYPGSTSLIIATRAGRKDIAQLLLDHHALIDKTDMDGETALHEAVLSRQNDLVRFLLDKGADVTIKDKNGDTPLAIAKRMAQTHDNQRASARVEMLEAAAAK